MPVDPQKTTYFKQARFTTRLPNDYLYTPSHYWLRPAAPGLYEVGVTRFASRMLGDFVEVAFEPTPGDAVSAGQPVGTLEGFKAVSEVYCALSGVFQGGNPAVAADPELVDTDPYDRGWLYRIEGTPGTDVLDTAGYIELLNITIEKMLAQQAAQEKKQC